MSSYSEYLARKMQRTPKFVDTRPHRDAGHQTEVIKRLAAASVLEQTTTTFSGNLVLNAPSTRVNAPIKGGHSVQDAQTFAEYEGAQAVAQSEKVVNRKATQIQEICYTATTIPEFNDTLRTNSTLAAIQSQKNAYQRGWNSASCCKLCGEPVQFADSCNCRLTVAQQVALPTSGGAPRVPS
jgi:hypothetical protein